MHNFGYVVGIIASEMVCKLLSNSLLGMRCLFRMADFTVVARRKGLACLQHK